MLDSILGLVGFFHDQALWGGVLFIALTFLTGVTLLPLFAWELTSGAVFGPWMAFIVMSIAVWLIIPFSIFAGRQFLHPFTERLLQKNPKASHMLRALEKKGFLLMVLVRLSPLTPFGATNYLLSLSRLPWWKITLATWLGGSPLLILLIFIGSTAADLSKVAHQNQGLWVYWLSLVVVGLVVWIVGRVINKALEEYEAQF